MPSLTNGIGFCCGPLGIMMGVRILRAEFFFFYFVLGFATHSVKVPQKGEVRVLLYYRLERDVDLYTPRFPLIVKIVP